MHTTSAIPTLTERHVHFVGIGGIGMSGIAQLMAQLGYTVSGSDAKASTMLETLAGQGVQCHVGHHPEYLRGAELVVATSAVNSHNAEVAAAQAMGIPVISRARMLGCLMNSSRGIAVAGTHGKTTTTALIASMLAHAGYDPTAIVGGMVKELGGNARLGLGEFFVAEADESDGSLVALNPEIVVVNNIDTDHLDHYGSLDAIVRTFSNFLSKVPANGAIFLAVDDPNCLQLSHFFAKQVITFALDHPADYRAVDVQEGSFATEFTVLYRGQRLGTFHLNRPGRFNVANALAAIAVGRHVGLTVSQIQSGLAVFQGVKRRFDILHNSDNMIVVDDYAHHPAEIKATLSAARANHSKRIIGVFQPHRYSRVSHLHADFGHAFENVDEVVLTDIYAAGEAPMEGIDHRLLLSSLATCPGSPRISYIPQLCDIAPYIQETQQPRDLVITLGAGDIWKVAAELAATAA
ncbi:MAG: UDP-N-acetylmuramate--L-alanine ligase [bacterium]